MFKMKKLCYLMKSIPKIGKEQTDTTIWKISPSTFSVLSPNEEKDINTFKHNTDICNNESKR